LKSTLSVRCILTSVSRAGCPVDGAAGDNAAADREFDRWG
jgi:hypothetical protein